MQPPAVVTRYPIADTACSSRWTRLSRCDSRSLQASRSISQCSLCYLIHSRGKGRHSPWGTSTVTASRTSTWGARMGFPESCSCNVPAAALWNQSRGSRGQPTAPTRTGERHSSMPMATACPICTSRVAAIDWRRGRHGCRTVCTSIVAAGALCETARRYPRCSPARERSRWATSTAMANPISLWAVDWRRGIIPTRRAATSSATTGATSRTSPPWSVPN